MTVHESYDDCHTMTVHISYDGCSYYSYKDVGSESYLKPLINSFNSFGKHNMAMGLLRTQYYGLH